MKYIYVLTDDKKIEVHDPRRRGTDISHRVVRTRFASMDEAETFCRMLDVLGMIADDEISCADDARQILERVDYLGRFLGDEDTAHA